jgi:dimethylglycine dehydrogenase
MVGLEVPIVNIVHQFLVTENMPEIEALETEPPVTRDPRSSCYLRQEQRGMIIGPYETEGAEPWGLEGIDWGFDMELLPPDVDRLMPWLELAIKRIPALGTVGIKQVVSGPITHTPDDNFLLGPAPGLPNFWMCCGASIGITQGPGCGKYLAQWMVHGQTEINVREMDPRRYGGWAAGKYNLDKSIDAYHQMYQVHLPGEFRDAGRPVKATPIYQRLKDQGAVYAEAFGWERPKWFAPEGVEEGYSFRRSNAFEHVAAECRAVRERAGLLDLTSFAKLVVVGRDAEAFLDRVSANRMPRREGGIVLAHMLTDLGGIEGEATVTRVGEGRFYLLSSIVAQLHDHDWLVQHIAKGEDVAVHDVTDETGVLVLSGPRSRDALAGLTGQDLGNEAFPWLTAREIEVAGVSVLALRVSYAGELGWELHVPIGRMAEVYDVLMAAGEGHGIANFGVYALNSLRMEKGYKAWGSELTTEITPVEADIMRFVKLDKDFIGRDAVLARQTQGIQTQLVLLAVDADDADALGNEPVFDGERLIGVTTGGAYGHAVGQSLAFAYVEPASAAPGSEVGIDILGQRRGATVLAEPPYDPRNKRLRDVG